MQYCLSSEPELLYLVALWKTAFMLLFNYVEYVVDCKSQNYRILETIFGKSLQHQHQGFGYFDLLLPRKLLKGY